MRILILSVESKKTKVSHFRCGHKTGTIQMKMYEHCTKIFGNKSIPDNAKNKKQLITILECHNIIPVFKDI